VERRAEAFFAAGFFDGAFLRLAVDLRFAAGFFLAVVLVLAAIRQPSL
jgi:hypothetical protein